jgi:hypothetical protein
MVLGSDASSSWRALEAAEEYIGRGECVGYNME